MNLVHSGPIPLEFNHSGAIPVESGHSCGFRCHSCRFRWNYWILDGICGAPKSTALMFNRFNRRHRWSAVVNGER